VALTRAEIYKKYLTSPKGQETRARYKAKNAERIKKQNAEYRARVGQHQINTAGTEAYSRYRSSESYRRTCVNTHLKRHYGITLEEYERMYEEQGGSCKICGGTDTRQWRDGRTQRVKLFVDHEHKTNRIRGLLCNKCNVGVAMFNDSEDIMLRAAKYLKEN